ncbi:MAG: aspartate kinase [Oscillospiraceae bacterium]|nr:aspartate kinase [Oscillospiraceae bacterium]
MTDIIITENQSIVTFNNVTASYENSFIYEVLEKAAESGISIDMIAQSPATSEKISFGFTFNDDALPKLLPIIKSQNPLINSGNVKLTVKSREMVNNTGFASNVFAVLKKLGCVPMLITTGLDEISLLVHQSNRVDLERELREIFI